MSLSAYHKKRNFQQTSEPRGVKEEKWASRFVVQKHQATRLHYDFRLELGGVLVSWAVPKGPSMDPSEKRLAVHVEDHPVSYIDFKGMIPVGNYGAGKVEIWDKGKFVPVDASHRPITEKQALAAIRKGELKIELRGKRLKGEFVLVRMKDDVKHWLLIKHKDQYAGEAVGDLNDRNNKRVAEVNDEYIPQESSGIIKAGKYKVPVTNLQKVYFPDDGLTKGDVLQYYEKIAPFILPYLKNRTLSLNRMPQGIAGDSFYHKDAGEHAPAFVKTAPIQSEEGKTIDYIVCNNLATLLYVANLGSIEMNPSNNLIQYPEHPEWMALDLDPSPKNSFAQVVEVALTAKQLFDKAGVSVYCKTSGATGLHLYVPLHHRYHYDQVKDFALIIARKVQEKLPKITTLERSLSKRGPKIYLDHLQNRRGQTLASVYSLRPKAGATVSTPLDWKEVNAKLSPAAFNILSIFERLKKKGDLFAPVLTGQNDLRSALTRMNL